MYPIKASCYRGVEVNLIQSAYLGLRPRLDVELFMRPRTRRIN